MARTTRPAPIPAPEGELDVPDDAARYSLDDLAEQSGVPGRTIRFYRQSGLIGAPERVGRNAYYSEEQLARVRQVAALREQGLGLDAIARLLADPVDSRQSLASLLKIGDELRAPWVEEREATLDEVEILEILGIDDPSSIPTLERYGMIEKVPRSKPPRYRVASVGAVELAGRLQLVGVQNELASQAWTLIHDSLAALASDLVRLFAEHPEEGFAGWPAPDAVSRTFDELRPVAMRAVELAFAHEIQAALDRFVERGGVFEADQRVLPARRKTDRRRRPR